MEHSIRRRKSPLSPIWILPILALCIGGWLAYTSHRDAGIDITVHFSSADGITPGKTKVVFKGIPIGTVEKITIDETITGVYLNIEIEKRAKALLVKDTAFWIVKPEVSAGRITGLETLFSGSTIGVQKGVSQESATHFIGLKNPPKLSPKIPGLRFSLISDIRHSLERGSKIYTKNLEIGHIEQYQLLQDEKIRFDIFVKEEFAHLIKKETRFWNSSGLSLTGNLRQGLTLNVESFASLMYGGISCATPSALVASATPAENDTSFTLYNDFEAAEYGIPMTLQLNSGDGIIPGKTEVQLRGLKVGIVKHMNLNHDQFNTVTATIFLDPRAEVILRENTKFWLMKPEVKITGITNLGTLITGSVITFIPGDGPFCDSFSEEEEPMPRSVPRDGTSYTLLADDAGSLSAGAPLLYKKYKVGEITDIHLSPNDEKVKVTIFIYEPYDVLIKKETIFWNVSGIAVDAKLSDLKISLASVETFLSGGIAFTTPAELLNKPVAAANSAFPLYQSYDDAEQANRKLLVEGQRLKVSSQGPASISIGSPVLYKKIRVGEVASMDLDKATDTIIFDLLIHPEYGDLVQKNAKFFIDSGIHVDVSLQGMRIDSGSFESIMTGGIAFINAGSKSRNDKKTGYRLYDSFEKAHHADYPRITLFFEGGEGVTERTKLLCQGIQIGQVESVQFNDDATSLVGKAYIEPRMMHFFREKTTLRIVRPEVSLGGIKNVSTVLTGPYIEVTAGSGSPLDTFRILDVKEENEFLQGSLNIVLESPRLGSLNLGSPVYYRQIQVGRITGHALAPTNQSVWIYVNIAPEHADLIYSGTRFWLTSGISVSGGVFSGMTVRTESMQSFIKGGVSLATPEEDIGAPAKNGDHFELALKAEPEWHEWSPVLPPKPEGVNTEQADGQSQPAQQSSEKGKESSNEN